MILMLIVLLETLTAFILTRMKNISLLQLYIVANMLAIWIFWQKLIEILSIQMNIWTLVYPFAVFAQYILLNLSDEAEVIRSTKYLFIIYLYFTALWFLISLLPMIFGNETISLAISAVAWWSVRIVIAAFIAFVIAQIVLITSYRKYVYIISTILMQLVDSLFFFWIAFWWVTSFMLYGFLIKVSVWLLLYPLYRIVKK